MPTKLIFLMGAPLPGNLNWDTDTLLSTPIPPFQDTRTYNEDELDASQRTVKWRVLQPLSTDEVKDHHAFYYGLENTEFLTSCQFKIGKDTSTTQDDSALSDFYDHSFAMHEASELSNSELRYEASTDSWTGLASINDESDTHSSAEGEAPKSPPALRIPGQLRDLQDVPSARYLQSIAPQTMTVNLIAGVIAVHPPRRVVTRQWKSELDIVEMVVGDETRTGFGVNFWLPSAKPDAAPNREIDRLRQSLARLRPQDVVLLRTVGLGSFRDRVYGQSLRGGMTQVDLLYRPIVNMTDAEGFYKVLPSSSVHDELPLQKVRRVREWMLQFVGAPHEAGGGMPGMSPTQRGHRLPPDSQ